MRTSNGVKGFLLAAGFAVALLAFTSDVHAAGALVDGVMSTAPEDMIPGMPADHAHYRARIAGTAALPYGRGTFAYSVPVWIVTPADQTLPTTALVDPPHTNGIRNRAVIPDGREGERPLAVYALLGPQFLFESGRSYTWVSVRWDNAALSADPVTAGLRYDHRFADAHSSDPGTNGAPATLTFAMGAVIIADLADALRSGTLTIRGETSPQPFANIQLVAALGYSQTASLLEPLLFDPLGPGNGAEEHHVPLFDLWLIGSAGGQVVLWPGSSASRVLSATPESSGVVIMFGTEQDVGPKGSYNLGNEWLRFSGLSHWKSYELAGASHVEFSNRTIDNVALLAPDGTTVLGGPIFLPDLDDPMLKAAAMLSANRTFVVGGVQRDLADYFADPAAASADGNGIPWLTATGPLYRNPLNIAPFVRALFAAGEARVRYGTPLPENAWLPQADGNEPVNGAERSIPVDAQGLPQFLTDALGNTRGSLQHPFSAAGRGRFYARHPLAPSNLQGSYVDRGFLPVPSFQNHGAFVSAVSRQADELAANGYFLAEDAEAIVEMAERSLEGMPSTSAKPPPEPTGADGEVGPFGD